MTQNLFKDFFDDDWHVSGHGYDDLMEVVSELDENTSQESVPTSEAEILSYIEEAKGRGENGEDMIAYYIFNKDTIEKNTGQWRIRFNASGIEKDRVLPFLKDWQDVGLLIRDHRGSWYSISEKALLAFTGKSGSRVSATDKSNIRDAHIMETLIKNNEALSLLVRYSNKDYGKIFGVHRGKYVRETQKKFAQKVKNIADFAGDETGMEWEITDFSISHYETKVMIEPRKRDRKKATPGVIFTTSDTGDATYLAEAVVRTKEAINVIADEKKKHVSQDALDIFAEKAESVPKIAVEYVEALESLRNHEIVMTFDEVVNAVGLKTAQYGKKNVTAISKAEGKKSLKYDKDQYDVINRVLELTVKVKNSEEVRKKAAECLRCILEAKKR